MIETDEDFEKFLTNECHYMMVKRLPDGRYSAVAPLIATYAIVIGDWGNEQGYNDRWCYHDLNPAIRAFNAWDGTGEPTGWHRHPKSGRRLAEDDHSYDEVGRLVPQGEIYVRH
jgi:hypothetical protein